MESRIRMERNTSAGNNLADRIKNAFIIWMPDKKQLLRALVLLTGGLAITFVTAYYLKTSAEKNAWNKFVFSSAELKEKISERLHDHALLLRSQASFVEEMGIPTRKEWKNIYFSQKIEENLPGVLGLGFAILIPPDKLAENENKIRKEGFPHYTVWPAGKRDIYTSIIYLEPFSGRNLRAFGYDMYSEPVRRKAMELARDYNIPSLSGKIKLVQETGEDLQAGALMYVPVYNKNLPAANIEERRKAILGWVYSPYRMNDLLSGIMGNAETIKENNLRLLIYDDSTYTLNGLLYDSRSIFNKNISAPLLYSQKSFVTFNGHNWYLQINQYNTPVSGIDYSKARNTAVGGTIVSALIFMLYLSLMNTNARARKLADELTKNLAESEGKYKAIFNNEIYAISVFDPESLAFIDVNETHCRMYGYSREEFYSGMTITDLITDVDTDILASHEIVKGNSVFIPLRFHKKKDGIIFPVEIVAGSFSWNGKMVMFALTHDITVRRAAEEQLKKWAHVFENAQWGVVVSSADGKFTEMINPTYASMHGYTIDELIGKPVESVFPPQLSNTISENIEIANLKGHHVWEADHIRKDGSVFPVLMDVTCVKDEAGNVLYRVVNVQDITERRKAELQLKKYTEELQEINNTKDRLFAIIAHDLRSPFTGILGYADILANEYDTLSEEERTAFIGSIDELSNSAYKLLENLLEWARLQTGKISFNPENLNLFLELYPTLTLVKETAGNKNISIRHSIEQSISVKADKYMLSTIVRNLVSNSIKFTNPGGIINITASVAGSFAQISVADNGIGIEEANLTKLFGLDKPRTTLGTANEKGTGLGLLLCREMVEKNGGRIWAESKLNEGTIFHFTLPVA